MTARSSPSIRTFRGADSRSALAAVKAALGPDAMILSAREIGASLFRAGSVEVTAAVTEGEPVLPAGLPPVAAAARAVERYADLGIRAHGDVDAELDALRACMAETQSAVSSLARQARLGQDLQLAPAAAEFLTSLCMQGIEPILAEELVRQLAAGGVPRTGSGFRGPARQALARLVRSCPPPWQPGDQKRRVVALVGPTGVGKTTTLAKVAARALLEHRQRVALITFDTYRIGAAEQIAHYGNLLDAPTFVARDQGELQAALGRCPEASLVLIDTAGRSSMDEVVKQAELARAIPGVELHLVLSAVTGAQDLSAIARRYCGLLLPAQLIFTKVDEAAAPGGLLSAISIAQRPVCCIGTGQRVPEDLEPQTDEDLIDLVLGESRWTKGRNS